MRRNSFAFRLAAAFAGVGITAAALTAILVNVAFGNRYARYLEQQQAARQHELSVALADSYRRMQGWSVSDLQPIASMVFMDGGTLRLLDASGAVVWNPRSMPSSASVAQMHRQMMGTGPLGPESRLAVRVDGIVVGTAVVRLPRPGLLPQEQSFRSSVNRLLLLAGLSAGLIALIVGVGLARRATNPVRELSAAARTFARGDRRTRIARDTPDEFGDMAASFNALADSVEEEDRLRRAFAGDVAHELRTPLAILRSEVEAIQDGVAHATPAALASLHDEILRMGRLVADLETLASADAASFSLSRRPTSLRAVLDETAREFRGPYAAAGVTLDTELVDVVADVDPTRIRQVIGNLLSNALKFTPEGGRVLLELSLDGSCARIRVSDTGAGIPEDEIPRVFDRFFRGARTRAGGSGVGLTVVRDLVHAHGGSVQAKSQSGQGAVFTVTLPSAGDGSVDGSRTAVTSTTG